MNTLRHATPLTREEELRNQQIEDARRMGETDDEQPAVRRTLRVVHNTGTGYERRPAARGTGDSKRPPLKGHEAFLKALELSNADVVIEKCDATIYKGKVKHSDKWSVTMRTSNQDGTTTDRVIFKHDISEFHTTTTPRAALPVADANTEEGHAV